MPRKTRKQKRQRRKTRRGGVLPDEVLANVASYSDRDTRMNINRMISQPAYRKARKMTRSEIENFDQKVVFQDLKYLSEKLKEPLSSEETTKAIVGTFTRVLTPSGIQFMKKNKQFARVMNQRALAIPNEKPAEWFEDPAYPERMIVKGLARKVVLTTNDI